MRRESRFGSSLYDRSQVGAEHPNPFTFEGALELPAVAEPAPFVARTQWTAVAFFALLSGLFALAVIMNTAEVAQRLMGHARPSVPRPGVIVPAILSALLAGVALACVPRRRVPTMVLGVRTFSLGGDSIEFTAPPRLDWRAKENVRLLVVHDGVRGITLNPWLFSTPKGWSVLKRLAECATPGSARDELLAVTAAAPIRDQRKIHPATMVALGSLGLLFVVVLGLMIWVRTL